MMRVFLGTDRRRAREALSAAAGGAGGRVIRITDTSSLDDLRAALAGGGMFAPLEATPLTGFAQKRTVVLDQLSDNEDLWNFLIDSLEHLAESADSFYVYEEKPDAATKRLLQKHAHKLETFDAPKAGKERPTVFTLVEHMRAGDKKKLWVAYQQELAQGNAPEAIHGVLFWGAKQALLTARGAQDIKEAKELVIKLVELPHESRRKGEELEYALERFVLSVA